MAEIFRAVAVGEQGFERTVAIKRIREEVVELADISKLFADEARVSALLDHPNIVQVYDFGAVDGTYYIAMEYLKGRNLEQVLSALRSRSERLAPSLAVLIARDVARGLAYAHTRTDERGRPLSIVHRDVSPANIMLTHMGAVKLLDFGIARITSELRLAVTRGRALRGKCPYLAPEQITSEGDPDGRADLFALGAVLWEMLTNRRLFVGASDFDILASVLNREVPAPSSLVPGLPSQLDGIVLRALARDPEERYQDADALAHDLDDVMQFLPTRYGDLGALVSRLPQHPTQEVRLPVAPPPPSPPRFELVLPPAPTPDPEVRAQENTRPAAGATKNEETKKVGNQELLAQLSRNPARAPMPPARSPRRTLLLAAMGLLLLIEGAAAFFHRRPLPEGRAQAAGVEKLPPAVVLEAPANAVEVKPSLPAEAKIKKASPPTKRDPIARKTRPSTAKKDAAVKVEKAARVKDKKIASATEKASTSKSRRGKAQGTRSKGKGTQAAPARVVSEPTASGPQPIAHSGR